MKIPERILYRIYLSLEDNVFRKFYWFEMKNDELYWGPSSKGRPSPEEMKITNETTFTIKIPDNLESIKPVSTKYSYHKSGKFHKKELDGDNEKKLGDNFWKMKDEISKPTLIHAMITRTLENYEIKTGKLNKKNEFSTILKFENLSDISKRLYIEFYLTPEGEFKIPDTMIKMIQGNTKFFRHSLSQKLILVVRYAIVSIPENWQPNVEISFIPDKI